MDEAGNQLPRHLERVFYRPSLARVIGVHQMTPAEKVFELEMESGKPPYRCALHPLWGAFSCAFEKWEP
jgi:hypothetical protein